MFNFFLGISMEAKCCVCKKKIEVIIKKGENGTQAIEPTEDYKPISVELIARQFVMNIEDLNVEDVVDVDGKYVILCSECYKKVLELIENLKRTLDSNPHFNIMKYPKLVVVIRNASSIESLLDVFSNEEILKSKLYVEEPYGIIHAITYYSIVRGVGLVAVAIPITVFINMVKKD